MAHRDSRELRLQKTRSSYTAMASALDSAVAAAARANSLDPLALLKTNGASPLAANATVAAFTWRPII